VSDTGTPSLASQVEQLSLGQRQELLVECLGQLFGYAKAKGYKIRLGEGRIGNPRRLRSGEFSEDGVHMVGSLHYDGLAQDLNLFVDGEYITDGTHMAWVDLGSFWEQLHPLCAWGGRFKSRDSNHVSIRYQGKA
jgi:hypothetical protein